MDGLTHKDVYHAIELLSEDDVRSVLRDILNDLREDRFAYPTPDRLYLPYTLWKALKKAKTDALED